MTTFTKLIADQILTDGGLIEGALEPHIVADPNGGFHISLSDEFSDDDFDTRRFSFDENGVQQTISALSSTPGNFASRQASITYLSDGRYVAVWTNEPTGSVDDVRVVKAEVFNADGTINVAEFFVEDEASPGSQSMPVVAASADGGFAIAYYDDSSPGIRAVVKVYDEAGTTVIATHDPINTTAGVFNFGSSSTSFDPMDLVALDDGTYFLAWTGDDNFSRAQRFDAGGSTIGQEIDLNGGTQSGIFPRITVLEDGRILVTTTVSGVSSGEIFNTDGTISVATFEIATSVRSGVDGNFADVSALPDGRIVAVWVDSVGEIKGQILNADGTKDGAVFDIATVTDGDQARPTITVLESGQFAVAWETTENDRDDIKFTIFGPPETPSLNVTTTDDVVNEFDGETSLREAIAFAEAGDTITFAESIESGTIRLDETLGALVITDGADITIDGDSDDDGNAITISGDTDDNGTGNTRLLTVESGATVSITSATLTEGREEGADGGGNFVSGATATGGIVNDGMLTLTDVILSNNVGIGGDAGGYDSAGGGGYGAIQNRGSLTLNGVDFENNTGTGGLGGPGIPGMSSVGGEGGDGGRSVSDIFNTGTLQLQGTGISLAGGNATGGVGGVGGDGDSISFGGGTAGGLGGDGGDGGDAAAIINSGSIGEGLISVQPTSATAGSGGSGGRGANGTDSNGSPGAPGNDGQADALLLNVDNGASTATTTLVVSTLDDVVNASDGVMSLREAIELAASIEGPDTITFDAALDGETITLAGTELVLTSDVTINGDIDGDGAADITIDGNEESRVFNVASNTTSTLTALTIQNGYTASTGGGIRNFGNLTVSNSTLSENRSEVNGGGIYNGGTLTVTNSTLTGNSADFGGGIYNEGDLTVTNSTLSGNNADSGGGGIRNPGDLTVTNSIVLGNTAELSGADIDGSVTTRTASIIGDVDGIAAADVFAEVDENGAGVLADNGGGVLTIALRASLDNPALDIGDVVPGLTTDATGNDRSFDVVGVNNGGTVDAGAVELPGIPETSSLIVTTTTDVVDALDGETSLREAIAFAATEAGADTITFDDALSGGQITLNGTELFLTSDVTINGDIDGHGAADITIDGNEESRVFNVASNTTSTLTALTIQNGNVSNSGFGGGIRNSGDLTVTNSTLRGNNVGFGNGGGIDNGGTLTVTNSTLTGNSADFGGGIYNVGDLTVTNSIVLGNTAEFSGADIDGSIDTRTASIIGDVDGIAAADVFAEVDENGAGVLADNGGGVLTIALLNDVSNPALDAGDDSAATATDAAGNSRDIDFVAIANNGSNTSDLGALELLDNAPVVTSATTVSVAENQTSVIDVQASDDADVEGNGLTYTLGTIEDSAAFDIDAATGVLTFRTAPDFETPRDRGGNNTYIAVVLVTDSLGNVATTNITAIVTNVNEAPVLATPLADQSSAEDEALSFDVPAGAFTDVDSNVTLSATQTSGAALPSGISFDAATGVFSGTPPTDFNGTISIRVTASDGSLNVSDTFDLVITPVDDPLTLTAPPAGDTLEGGTANDTLTGGFGDDTLTGNGGDDVIVDPGGDDTIDAGAGDDRVGLLSGTNTVDGGEGSDLIVGGFNNDVLTGGTGNDVIRGDASTRLFGNDEITGGRGNDLLEGGGGVDTFVFKTADGNDTIGTLSIDYDDPSNSTVTGADFVSGVDLVQLDGFGLADDAAALAAVSDVDGVATFNAEGTSITFIGLTADDLSADDFILV